MINNKVLMDKTNYNDLWLRNVLIGFLAYLENRINWVNNFEDESVQVNVPFYGALSGDTRYILDLFKDDIPIDRVDMNTDQIPRGAVSITSWSFKSEEFTNPNTAINTQIEIDDELQEVVAQCKMMPIKVTVHVDIIVDSEADVMKAWESLMVSLFIYKYFTYEHKRLPINAVFNIPTDFENPVVRNKTFGDNSSKSSLIIPLDIDIHTVFPIFDYKNSISNNKQVEWILQLWNQNRILNREKDIIIPNTNLGEEYNT